MSGYQLAAWCRLHAALDGGKRFADLLLSHADPERELAALAAQPPVLRQGLIHPILEKEAFLAKLQQTLDAGTRVVTLLDPDYPELLQQCQQPPGLLYVRGTLLPADRLALAGVGSRKVSAYGRQAVDFLVPELVAKGYSLVSGLAMGIDAAVHRTCLQSGGRTLAVLGCGIDIIYPACNRDLWKSIPEQGAIISEFPPGTAALPAHFPRRNRIISGLSLGVIVFEAAMGSGSLLTAHWALHQNREVFAVPRPIFDMEKQGTNALIQQGAKLVMTPQDVFAELPATEGLPHKEKNRQFELPLLTKEESLLLNAIPAGESLHIDTLAAHTLLPMDALHTALLSLELKGLIEEHRGKNFRKRDH